MPAAARRGVGSGTRGGRRRAELRERWRPRADEELLVADLRRPLIASPAALDALLTFCSRVLSPLFSAVLYFCPVYLTCPSLYPTCLQNPTVGYNSAQSRLFPTGKIGRRRKNRRRSRDLYSREYSLHNGANEVKGYILGMEHSIGHGKTGEWRAESGLKGR